MQKIFVILLVISPLYLFGQLKKTKIIMTDGTLHKGKIIEYNESEIKLIVKMFEVITIPKSEISNLIAIEFDNFEYITIIKSTNGSTYQGKLIKENDTEILLEIAFKTTKSIDKSTIVSQKNVRKKYIKSIRIESVLTKDKKIHKGRIIDKKETYIILESTDGYREKINTDEILEYTEKVLHPSTILAISTVVMGTINSILVIYLI